MKTEARLEALSVFLKTKRARLHPHMVGLPQGSRRRTPGLRREEVAQLAGVSTTWYTWLEQGRDIKVSASVLDAIAAALQLNTDERKYLYDLAIEAGSHSLPVPAEQAVISPLCKRSYKSYTTALLLFQIGVVILSAGTPLLLMFLWILPSYHMSNAI